VRIRYALFAVTTAAAVALPVAGARADGPPREPRPAPATPSAPDVASRLRLAAAKTEATAYQQYNAYAATAGNRRLADVWRTVADVEYMDHWRSEIDALRYYSPSDNAANLALLGDLARRAAAADEARAAAAPSGSAAPGVLRAVAAREAGNARLLSRAEEALRGYGGVPTVESGPAVAVVVSPRPRYSGAFYRELTDPSDSAFQVAAWLRAGYRQAAMTAVDTGRPDLAAMFAGLAAGEQTETIPTLLNLAGYVNSPAMNLKSSVEGETEAIDMYTRFAHEADRVGAPTAASDFREYARDEAGHRRGFAVELRALAGRG
jgi:rubrerythrin